MAQCRMCKKRGLFLRLSPDGFCRDCQRRSPEGVAILRQCDQNNVRYAREAQVCKSIEVRLMASADWPPEQRLPEYEWAINEYEHFFGEPEYGYALTYADLCSQAGLGDRAWAILNELSMRAARGDGPKLKDVRWHQWNIAKREEHWLQAVELHACYYVLHGSVPASYLKVMRPMAKKAGLTLEQIGAVEALVRNYAAQRPGDEAGFTSDFRRLVRAQI